MSPGHHIRPNINGPSDPLIINRTPIVINREPEGSSIARATSETRPRPRPRSLTLYRIFNPFTRRTHGATIATEASTIRQRRESTAEQSISLRPASRRGRPSSPPPPPIISQRTTRSLSPFHRVSTMPPQSGEQGYVPLPPRLPPEEESQQPEQQESRGRGSRAPQAADNGQAIGESQTRHHSPRRSQRHSRPAGPFDPQELVIEPASRGGESYEITPHEPVRSRPPRSSGDVRNSREYRDMKALAERNYRVAEEAAQRCSTAEVRLQNLQRQLAEMTLRENKANEVSDDLRRELDRTQSELVKTRSELELCRRDHRFSTRQRDLAQDQLDLERDRARNREREAERITGREVPRESSGSGNSGQRHRHRVSAVVQDPGSRVPRTTDPRGSGTTNTPAPAPTGTNLGDAGTDAINIARAEAARRGGKSS